MLPQEQNQLFNHLGKVIMTIIATLFLQDCYSQNLISNPDFELYTELPNKPAQWYKCIGWHNLNGTTEFTEPFGSPDYFHDFGSFDAGLPNVFTAYVKPYSGDAIMGFVTAASGIPEYKEYISTEFMSPMIPGLEYEISFYMTNGENDWSSSSGCDHIGLLLSVEQPTQVFNEPVLRQPQLEIEGTIWNTEWEKHSFTFTADSAYKHITLGAFVLYKDLTFQYGSGEPKNKAYNFVDKFEVSSFIRISGDTTICLGDSLLLHAYNDTVFKWSADSNPDVILSYESDLMVAPKDTTVYYVYGRGSVDSIRVIPSLEYCEPILQMPNIFTPNSDGLNDYFAPIYSFAIKNSTLNIVNRWGNIVYTGKITNKGWNGKTNFEMNPDGTYFWEVSYEGYNGKSYSKYGNVTLVR